MIVNKLFYKNLATKRDVDTNILHTTVIDGNSFKFLFIVGGNDISECTVCIVYSSFVVSSIVIMCMGARSATVKKKNKKSTYIMYVCKVRSSIVCECIEYECIDCVYCS